MQKLNSLKLKLAAAGALALGVVAPAMAAGTDPFTDTMTTMTTNVTTYGTALAGLAAVGVGFFVAIKYIRKIIKAA